MVLLAAAVCTKPGKALLSRQFVEMTRARIEGLLAAFPKLLSSEKGGGSGGRQHTFVETDSVRYVYQPMDQLYVLLITTKASNILEDLETLRLFSRVIPEYCRSMEEKEILEQAFQLIFAFDEIVALGYRENVNLAQIRTFTEMDSHEERVFYQIKKTQEEEARKLAKDKAKELAKIRADAQKRGGRGGAVTGISSANSKYDDAASTYADSTTTHTSAAPTKPSYTAPSRPSGPNKALKLGGKKVDEDQFISQLKSEGQDVATAPTRATMKSSNIPSTASLTPAIKMESVHIRTEERMNASISRDGGVDLLEAHGVVTLRVTQPDLCTVTLRMDNNDRYGAQIQTHPNLDKKAWASSNILQLKSAQKPFPINNDVGVLKWRFQTTDEANVPLSINCWPSETSQGCDVNIEYTLENEDLELRDLTITIPLPSGVSPVVGECDGEFRHDKPKSQLVWSLPLVDASNKTGTLEFTTNSGHADHFFPLRVHFCSSTLFCHIKPNSVFKMDDEGSPVPFSQETSLYTEKYEIV